MITSENRTQQNSNKGTIAKSEKRLKTVATLILLFFSLEYLGTESGITIYRFVIFPLSLLGCVMVTGMKRVKEALKIYALLLVVLIWLTVCNILTDNNPLFPIFTIPFVYFLVNFLLLENKIDINYPLIFACYSLPHILSVVFGVFELDSGRFCGLHEDPNFCGIFLGVAIIGSFFYLKQGKGRFFSKAVHISNIVLSGLLLFWTGSRGAMLSLVLIALYYFYTAKQIKIIFKILLTVCAIIAYNKLMAYINSLPEWVSPDVDIVDSILCRFQKDSMASGSHRTLLWETAFKEMFNESAYLTPIGESFAMRSTQNGFAHNTYISLMLEMGLIWGLLFDLYIIARCASIGLSVVKKKLDDELLVIVFASFSVLLQLFFLSAHAQKITWLFFVFAICVPSMVKRNSQRI